VNSIAKLLMALIASSILSGCVTNMYSWGEYEKDLYLYYKDPENLDEYSEELKKIVLRNEKTGRIPPGMFAEYGYILYEQGNTALARDYFIREKEAFPESTKFMDLAIQNLTESVAPQGDTTSANPELSGSNGEGS
jgi:hypothetical protein